MINCTLLISMHSPTKTEIKYWEKFYFKYRNEIAIHWLLDGAKIKLNRKINDEDIFYNKENKGRLLMVYEHIKGGNVNTAYFKNIDPDDHMSFKNFKEIDFSNKGYILSFYSTKVSGYKKMTQAKIDKTVNFLSKEKKFINNFGTSYTILPTLEIYQDTFFSKKRIYADDDQILGYLAFVNGAKWKKIDYGFYLYSKNVGQTRISNFSNLVNELRLAYEEYDSIAEKSNEFPPFKFASLQNHIKGIEKTFKELGGEISRENQDTLEFIYMHRSKIKN